jgi:RNA polymerase-binding transcription factor DksA
MDLADSATDEFDHDMAFSLLAHEQNALYEVNAAIRRIQDGTYGICEETGKAIPDERLQAVPWTRYTREVEERLENERGVQLAHLNLYPASRIPNLMAYQKRKTHHRKTH